MKKSNYKDYLTLNQMAIGGGTHILYLLTGFTNITVSKTLHQILKVVQLQVHLRTTS